jgi:hypothetical protein
MLYKGGLKVFGVFLLMDNNKINQASCGFIFRHVVGGILLMISLL